MQPASSGSDISSVYHSTEMIKNSISQFQNDAVNQQVVLLSLKQKRLHLEDDIKKKVIELNKAKDEQRLLEGELQNSKQRLEKLQKESHECEDEVTTMRSSVQDLMNDCKKEKDLQLVYLKDYETQMAELSQKILTAPQTYDKESLMRELSTLQQERTGIRSELSAIEKEISTLQSQFSSLVTKNISFHGDSAPSPDLSSALKLIIKESVFSPMASDNQKLEEEIKTLEQRVAQLRAEAKLGK